MAVAAPAFLAALLLLPLAAAPASAANFTCSTVGKMCQSAIDYAVPNATTYGEVVAQFNPTTTLEKLLGANGLPASTPASTPLEAKTMVRVPFQCRCGSDGVGQPADGGPVYVVYPDDGLDHIARDVFDGFVTYQEIATANDIANVDHIEIGQKLRIPLPCTCNQVKGADVMHLAYSVAEGDDPPGIADKFGVAENTLLSVNKITDHKSLQQGQILDVPLPVSTLGSTTGTVPLAPGPPPAPPVKTKGGLLLRVVIPVSFFIIIISLVAYLVVKHYQKKRKMENFQIVTGLKDFSYDNIKSATNNFDKDKLLGEGGFGKVYKGTFNMDRKTKDDLAVKCVTNPSAAKHLRDELRILAELKHKNMVQLVGFCNNDGWFRRGRGLYVCSEFISNGSLDKKIFAGSLGQPVIEWPVRYQIIRGICAGLQYLHQDHNSKILHMDLKPSNILLDEEMKPKIADFGLSRAFLNAKTHTYTDIVKGSLGYMAPEFVDHGRASRQCDIYSLGMLILGIVMRVGPPSTSRDPSGVSYISKVRDKFDFEETTTLKKCSAKDHEQLKKDASLEDDDSIEDVEKCVGLAFECVDVDPRKRPEAADICTRLNPNNRAHISLHK